MFPPFEQERAAGVVLDILQKLGSGSITLIRDSKPSDERNNSLVMLGVLVCKKTDAKEGEFVNLITVSGISCSLKGEIPGIFVEPVVSNGQILKALEENDLEIHELTDKIKKEVLPQKQAELKKQREKLCDASLFKSF